MLGKECYIVANCLVGVDTRCKQRTTLSWSVYDIQVQQLMPSWRPVQQIKESVQGTLRGQRRGSGVAFRASESDAFHSTALRRCTQTLASAPSAAAH